MTAYFNNLTIKKFIVLYLVSMLISSIVGTVIGPDVEINSAISVVKYILNNLTMHFMFILLIYIFSINKKERSLTFIVPDDSVKLNLLYIIIPFFISYTVGVLTLFLFKNIMPAVYIKLQELSISMFNNLKFTNIGYILLFFDTVIIVPVIEELIFRRVLYNLFTLNNKIITSIIYTSLIFMFAHGIFSPQLFIFSFFLTALYQVTGNIKYPMLAHIFNNFVTFIMILFSNKGLINNKIENALGITFIISAIFSLICILKNKDKYVSYLNKKNPIERIIL